MVPYQLKEDGTCNTCESIVPEKLYFECFKCENKYHADCDGTTPFCPRSSIAIFKKHNKSNFPFHCDLCLTEEEHVAASSVKEQLAEVVKTVKELSKEIKTLKENKKSSELLPEHQPVPVTAREQQGIIDTKSLWEDTNRLKKVKENVTVCIKSNGEAVDMSKVREVVTTNGVQINKASVNKNNGDVYIDLPSEENKDKLIPLLHDAEIEDNRVVNVKKRCPTISIRNVKEYIDDDDFIEKVKMQNLKIKEKIENGAEFTVVYKKDYVQNQSKNELYLIVLGIGELYTRNQQISG